MADHSQTAVVLHAVTSIEKAVANLLHNVAASIEQANRRCLETEIARYLGGPDAKLTDESERRIEYFLCHRKFW